MVKGVFDLCKLDEPSISLTPIPVFDWVGVDGLHFPKSAVVNQYVVVFADYLMKWPEMYMFVSN